MHETDSLFECIGFSVTLREKKQKGENAQTQSLQVTVYSVIDMEKRLI